MTLLIACLEWLWRERNDFYASGKMESLLSRYRERFGELPD
jgi:hypothetical protein